MDTSIFPKISNGARIDKISIAIGVVSILFLLGGVFFFLKLASKGEDNKDNTGSVAPIGETVLNNKKMAETVEEQKNDVTQTVSIPNLNRPIVIPSDVPESVATDAKDKLASVITALKQDTDDLEYWLDLGILRKVIKDIEGAKEAWEYAALLRPNDARAFSNLADLYIFYLHDNMKGEEYLRMAIERAPGQIQYYIAAFEFYDYITHDETKAKAVLEEGIKKNPRTSQVLTDLLSGL